MAEIKQAAICALAFYDIFNYPLTFLELHRNLECAANPEDLFAAIQILKQENKIFEEDGYFSLRAGLAEKRKARFLVSFKKLERAKKITKIFSRFPFVKFIGVCNSLGFFNAGEESDIDFFIIAERGRLWTTRFLLALPLIIFNLRPRPEDGRDKICLSFFTADENLNLEGIGLSGGDPYFYRWMGWILPLYDNKIYSKFLEENIWIKKYLPQFQGQNNYFNPRPRRTKKIFEKMFCSRLEKFLKDLQIKVMPQELYGATKRGDGSVVISDKMLKFHLLDRRAEYKNSYELRAKSYELKIAAEPRTITNNS